MMVLPEPEPVDYRLRKIKPNQVSSKVFTPFDDVRATQTNVGMYLHPLPNIDGEFVISKVPGVILNRWCDRMKQQWVPDPQRDAYFMFDLHRKFNVEPKELDPRYQHRSSIFPRSYKYEIDCFKHNMSRRLDVKIAYEEAAKQNPQVRKPRCICTDEETSGTEQDEQETLLKLPLRWQSQPKIFEKSQTDPCLRRAEFQKFRLPFRNEACNFYYTNYPMPKLEFRPHKFST